MAKRHQMAIQYLQEEIRNHQEVVRELQAAIEELTGGNSADPKTKRPGLKRSAIDLAIEALQEAGGEMTSAEIHEKIKRLAKVKLKSFKTMLLKEAKEGNQIEKVKDKVGTFRLVQAG